MEKRIKEYSNKFSEKKFWKKINRLASRLGQKTVYTALLLFYAYRRRETPCWARNIIIGALAYLIVPIDLIPDLGPLFGLTDDIGVLSFGLVTIAGFVNEGVRQQAKDRLVKWFGAYDEEALREVDAKL